MLDTQSYLSHQDLTTQIYRGLVVIVFVLYSNKDASFYNTKYIKINVLPSYSSLPLMSILSFILLFFKFNP